MTQNANLPDNASLPENASLTHAPIAPLPVTEITYTLKDAVPTKYGELSVVTLKRPNAGTLLRARAAITNNKQLGPAMAADGLTVGTVSMRLSLVSTNLPQTPADWTDYLSQPDLMEVLERFNALSEGYGADVEAYRKEVKRRVAEQEAEQRDQPFP